jgi:hypothetical protein
LSKRIFDKATSVDEVALEKANFLILSPFGEVTTRDGEQQFEVVTPFEAETWSIVAGYADRPAKGCADFERREDAIRALGTVGGGRPCWYADSSEQFQINDFAVLASRISGPRVYVISATDIEWDTDGKRVRGLPKDSNSRSNSARMKTRARSRKRWAIGSATNTTGALQDVSSRAPSFRAEE